MKKFLLIAVCMIAGLTTSAQVGIGTTTPAASAILDLTSTDKALLVTRVASTAAITTPLNGMIIYDTTSNCFKVYQNGAWTGCMTFLQSGSNGTAVVSTYSCNTASTGSMTAGTAVSGVTQTITATVTTVGTYNISATANGVTFAGSGAFAGTGAQAIVLTATGTPTSAAASPYTYTLNTDPSCSFNRTVVNPGDVVSPTGATWMDRNLGATQVATSSTDATSYGHLYQWGRLADGHQIRSSSTTGTLSAGDVPGNANFIASNSPPFDWRSPQNNSLWQGVSGTNNPCPTGYRLPTDAEWTAERLTWSTSDAAGAFASVLKLTKGGHRNGNDAAIYWGTTRGYYYSSTVSTVTPTFATFLYFTDSVAASDSYYRTFGMSVRCRKD